MFASKKALNVPNNDRLVVAAGVELVLVDGQAVDGVMLTTKHSATLSTEHLPHTNIAITTGSEHWEARGHAGRHRTTATHNLQP